MGAGQRSTTKRLAHRAVVATSSPAPASRSASPAAQPPHKAAASSHTPAAAGGEGGGPGAPSAPRSGKQTGGSAKGARKAAGRRGSEVGGGRKVPREVLLLGQVEAGSSHLNRKRCRTWVDDLGSAQEMEYMLGCMKCSFARVSGGAGWDRGHGRRGTWWAWSGGGEPVGSCGTAAAASSCAVACGHRNSTRAVPHAYTSHASATSAEPLAPSPPPYPLSCTPSCGVPRAGAATAARHRWRTAPWRAGSRMLGGPSRRCWRPLPTAPPRSSGRTPLPSSCPCTPRPPATACARWCLPRAGRRPLRWRGGPTAPTPTASGLQRGGSSPATCACAQRRLWPRRAGPAGGVGRRKGRWGPSWGVQGGG